MADSRNPAGGDGPTLLALFGLLLAAFALIGLAGLVLPQILGFAIVVGGFIIFGILQYLLWGRWLPRDRIDDDDDSSR